MSEALVLLHGSANGGYSWGPIKKVLTERGLKVFAPDMLGYGKSPAPSASFSLDEESEHLRRAIDAEGIDRFQLVTHSLGTMFGLHLRGTIPERVTRLTLVDPLIVSTLRVDEEKAALDEMEHAYQTITSIEDSALFAQRFVDHWSGEGAWNHIGDKARAVITSLVPRLRLEMATSRNERTTTRVFATPSVPTKILVGEMTRLPPLATARQLARAFGVELETVRGAGHMIPLTHPEVVVEAAVAVVTR